MKRWVYVVGAGASHEFDLPTGAKLREQIASILKFDRTNPHAWDDTLHQAFSFLTLTRPGRAEDMNSLMEASNWVARSMPLTHSIDTFIDMHAQDPFVAQVGKLAIGRAILKAEGRSKLMAKPTSFGAQVNFQSVTESWLAELIRNITSGVRYEGLRARLKEVGLVVFNYDRCVEHFVRESLSLLYKIGADETTDLLTNLEIHHPYGDLGPLLGAKADPNAIVAFGEEPSAPALISLAKRIRTFTEGLDQADSTVPRIREMVVDAENLVFLGFAFHPLNMELLFPASMRTERRSIDRGPRVFGTVLDKSESDQEVIADQLRGAIAPVSTLRAVKCGELFREYSHTFGWR